jgi:hypothetical protein
MGFHVHIYRVIISMLSKSEYYKSATLESFAKAKLALYDKYKDRFDVSKQSATGLIPWSQENFPELFDEVESLALARNTKVMRCRFFVTPKQRQLLPHTDGRFIDELAYALNIPILFAEEGHYMNWYTYHGSLATDLSPVYQNSLNPAEPEKLVLADKLTLTSPHYVKVGVFHGVHNYVNHNRIVLSIRFTDSFPTEQK